MYENSLTNPLRMRRGKILPEDSTMTSVSVTSSVRRSWFRSLLCGHPNRAQFTIIDHTQGPGWMADVHEGTCCTNCGLMEVIERIY